MMKRHVMLSGSSAGLAALMQVDSTVSFLLDREQGINLIPIYPSASSGYVWKRVFLRGKGHKGG